jgi:AraC-like DNA-binding protein
MELSTRGTHFYPEYAFPVRYQAEQAFAPDLGAGERLRLVLVEAGSGLLEVCGQQLDFIAPVLVCLNETERPRLERSAALNARAIYFHPGVINSSFTFETIRRRRMDEEEQVYWQDRASLRPFLVRGGGFDGVLPMGPVTVSRAIQLFDSARHQLVDQPDNYWVCRSRSFLLELLSLAEQLVMTPELGGARMAEVGDTPSEPVPVRSEPARSDAECVILYLHAHYHEKITIQALTRAFHTNRTTLTEQFRRATSMPVMAYLATLRMRQASLLLRDTILPVSEIMQRVGYQDSTHFWRTFRKHVGVSPSEYRERYSWLGPVASHLLSTVS